MLKLDIGWFCIKGWCIDAVELTYSGVGRYMLCLRATVVAVAAVGHGEYYRP